MTDFDLVAGYGAEDGKRMLPSKASSTQIYMLLSMYRRELTLIYCKAPRLTRNLIVQPLHTFVNNMVANYSMAYATTDKQARVRYMEKVVADYYVIESSLVEMAETKTIGLNRMGNMVKNIIEPLHEQIAKYYKYAVDTLEKQK